MTESAIDLFPVGWYIN